MCVQDKMLSMAVANHILWPLAQFVNAKLVPKRHQPVANKVVQVWVSTIHPTLNTSIMLVSHEQALARFARFVMTVTGQDISHTSLLCQPND